MPRQENKPQENHCAHSPPPPCAAGAASNHHRFSHATASWPHHATFSTVHPLWSLPARQRPRYLERRRSGATSPRVIHGQPAHLGEPAASAECAHASLCIFVLLGVLADRGCSLAGRCRTDDFFQGHHPAPGAAPSSHLLATCNALASC